MAAPQGCLRLHRDAQACTFQAEGAACMHLGLALRRAAESALAEGVPSLRVDLRRCSYMDSTFLGTLLCLQRMIERRGQGAFVVVSPSAAARTLIEQMGLNRVYPIVTEDEPCAGPWRDLVKECEDVDTFRHKVVQAHEELASLEGPAGAPFREVVRGIVESRGKK